MLRKFCLFSGRTGEGGKGVVVPQQYHVSAEPIEITRLHTSEPQDFLQEGTALRSSPLLKG
jgi:hypothetical protein